MSKKVTLRCGSRTTITSRKNAERYERHGRARRVSPNLYEMIEADPRHAAVERSIARKFSSGDGFATLEGLQNTPVVSPIRILTGKRPASPPREEIRVVVSVRRYVVCA